MENKARYLLNNILNKPFDEEKHSIYDFLTILEILIAVKMSGKHSTYSLFRSLSSLSHVALIANYLSIRSGKVLSLEQEGRRIVGFILEGEERSYSDSE